METMGITANVLAFVTVFAILVAIVLAAGWSKRSSSDSSEAHQPKTGEREESPVGEIGRDEEPANRETRRGATYRRARVEWVIDGDTVVVSVDQRSEKIRLYAIDCPEDGQPWGDTATYGLIKLIGRRHVYLEDHGKDCYGRTLATIHVQDDKSPGLVNVNEKMVMRGHAWVMRRFYGDLSADRKGRLNRLERWARSNKVGLWKTGDPIPPWEWRRNTNGNGSSCYS